MFVWLRRFMPASHKAKIVFAVLAVAAAILIIGFFALRAKKPEPSFDAGNIALKIKLRQDEIDRLNQDSDADGLKDWEEMLYHTDPHNPDTDGDGTLDGEEVKLGRDPTKPNTAKSPKKPDDYFATAEPLADKNPASLTPDKNLTADFTRTFLRGPLAQILAGDQPDIDTKNVERYADRLKGRSVLGDAPQFTIKDITINPANDPKTIGQYLESFRDIFGTLGLRGRNEMDVVAEALTSQDYGVLVEITTYPNAYQKALDNLRTTPVPKHLVSFHLAMLNYLSKFKRSNELFQKMESDPVLSIITINERLALNDTFNSSLTSFRTEIIAAFKK